METLLEKGEAVVFMTTDSDGHPIVQIKGNLSTKDDITVALVKSGFYKYNADKKYPWLAVKRRGYKSAKADIKRLMKDVGYTAENYGDENVIYKKKVA